MEHVRIDAPDALGDRARHWLAVIADLAFLVACLFVVYTSFGGEVHWKTAFFRITLTEPNRPIQLCVLALAVKAAFGLTHGLFASLAAARLPILGRPSASLHALDQACAACSWPAGSSCSSVRRVSCCR
jgi:TRAP-type C4-dicarboxylate transport system permease small subunit